MFSTYQEIQDMVEARQKDQLVSRLNRDIRAGGTALYRREIAPERPAYSPAQHAGRLSTIFSPAYEAAGLFLIRLGENLLAHSLKPGCRSLDLDTADCR